MNLNDIADIASAAGIVGLAVGVLLQFTQLLTANRHKRAEMLLNLSDRFYRDPDLLKIYAEVETGTYCFLEGSNAGAEDKLVRFFDNVAGIRRWGVITDDDIKRHCGFSYLVVYRNAEIQKYLKWQRDFAASNEIDCEPFPSFRELGERLDKKSPAMIAAPEPPMIAEQAVRR